MTRPLHYLMLVLISKYRTSQDLPHVKHQFFVTKLKSVDSPTSIWGGVLEYISDSHVQWSPPGDHHTMLTHVDKLVFRLGWLIGFLLWCDWDVITPIKGIRAVIDQRIIKKHRASPRMAPSFPSFCVWYGELYKRSPSNRRGLEVKASKFLILTKYLPLHFNLPCPGISTIFMEIESLEKCQKSL